MPWSDSSRATSLARYLLCSSDPQTLPLRELLALEPGAAERFGELGLGYVESAGGPNLRRAIARLYERCDDNAVLVHGGSQEPIFTFTLAALTAGDGAVVQFPAYQSQFSIAEAIGASVARWQSDLSRGGAPDPDDLERLIGPSTRVIILTTPNNPTGYAFDRARIDAVVAIARRHGLWLFSDEVYRGSERDDERIPAVCDLYERGISLGGTSKVYGLAGLRVGWIVTRDRALYERMALVKDYLTICNAAPSEFLAELAVRHHDALVARTRRIAESNLNLLDAFFARRVDAFEWTRPRAGTTAFPRYLAGSSEAFCRRAVETAGVLLLPSVVFDAGDEHVRFGYGRANLPEGPAALDAFMDRDRV